MKNFLGLIQFFFETETFWGDFMHFDLFKKVTPVLAQNFLFLLEIKETTFWSKKWPKSEKILRQCGYSSFLYEKVYCDSKPGMLKSLTRHHS